MSEKPYPALRREEWRDGYQAVEDDGYVYFTAKVEPVEGDPTLTISIPGMKAPIEAQLPEDLVALMALANHVLPDTDPRKITRAAVAMIREAISDKEDAERQGERWGISGDLAAWRRLADALESYLPPA